MTGKTHTSSSFVAAAYSLLLESSSRTRQPLSWLNLLHTSRQAVISFSNCDFSDASWSIEASPSAISRLTTDHSNEPIIIPPLVGQPSVLWHCWLGGSKGIRPVKNRVVGCWRGYLFGARCRLAYDPADATATHCLLLQQNPDWFYLSGTGSPE